MLEKKTVKDERKRYNLDLSGEMKKSLQKIQEALSGATMIEAIRVSLKLTAFICDVIARGAHIQIKEKTGELTGVEIVNFWRPENR